MNNSIGKVSTIKKVQIKLVDFSIMTIISVQCDNFEDYFHGNYHSYKITDTMTINKLLKQLSRLEPIDSTYSNNIDTRAKITFISDSDSTIICVGKLSMSVHNHIYKTPQSLINFVEEIDLKK